RDTSAPVMIRELPHPSLNVPHAALPPRVDADLNDPAWVHAATISRLTPSIGLATAFSRLQDTRVLVLWDDRGLHIRFVASDDYLQAPFDHHDDPHHEGDVVEVFFGSVSRYFEVQVSPRGRTLDKSFTIQGPVTTGPEGALLAENRRRMDARLHDDLEGLRAASQEVDGGWVVDLMIPAAYLPKLPGLGDPPAKVLANFVRLDQPTPGDINAVTAQTNWSPVVRGRPHISPQRFGELVLLPSGEAESCGDFPCSSLRR
ncbi:MAG: carbohydrate-binding family 9-like protein, partial [Planctomycetota bacterium]